MILKNDLFERLVVGTVSYFRYKSVSEDSKIELHHISAPINFPNISEQLFFRAFLNNWFCRILCSGALLWNFFTTIIFDERGISAVILSMLWFKV